MSKINIDHFCVPTLMYYCLQYKYMAEHYVNEKIIKHNISGEYNSPAVIEMHVDVAPAHSVLTSSRLLCFCLCVSEQSTECGWCKSQTAGKHIIFFTQLFSLCRTFWLAQ